MGRELCMSQSSLAHQLVLYCLTQLRPNKVSFKPFNAASRLEFYLFVKSLTSSSQFHRKEPQPVQGLAVCSETHLGGLHLSSPCDSTSRYSHFHCSPPSHRALSSSPGTPQFPLELTLLLLLAQGYILPPLTSGARCVIYIKLVRS